MDNFKLKRHKSMHEFNTWCVNDNQIVWLNFMHRWVALSDGMNNNNFVLCKFIHTWKDYRILIRDERELQKHRCFFNFPEKYRFRPEPAILWVRTFLQSERVTDLCVRFFAVPVFFTEREIEKFVPAHL